MDDEETELKREVKELLAHMDPMIYLAGTADNTSEMLAYLPDMDPAFHKLLLVKSLRKKMRDNVSRLVEGHIDMYLKEQKGKMRSENPVDHLVEKITSDNEFDDFVRRAKENVECSVKQITQQFDEEIVTGMFGNFEDVTTYTASPNESNESSLNSSFNQSGLLFLHPAEYFNVAKNLTKKDLESLNDALNILLAVTPGEPVMQESWPDIRKGLKECLFDDCTQVFDKALKVHCKLLTSQVHSAVKEAYLNLLDTLAGFYMTKRLLNKIPLKGDSIDLKSCENIIRILKVLIDFQKELPLIWIRYPERFVDDMVDATFGLLGLSVSTKDNTRVSLWDLYCVVDPEASWFKRWVHGQWGRSRTFSAMRSNFMVLLHLVSYCISYVDSDVDSSHCVLQLDADRCILAPGVLKRVQFTHSSNFVMTVLSFADGRKLFPVNVPSKDELVTIQGFLQILVKAVNKNISTIVNVEISYLIKKFCLQDEMKCLILCDAGAVELLLQDVSKLEAIESKSPQELDLKTLSSYIEAVLLILDAMLSTEVGQRYMLLGRKRKSSSKSGLSGVISSPAIQIMNLVFLLLKSKEAGSVVKRLGLSVCCRMLSSPVGIHMCVHHPLIASFIQHMKERQRSVCTYKLPHGEDPSSHESLCLSVPQSLPLLTSLLLSYKGVFLLENGGVLSTALTQVLQEVTRNGDLSPRMLATVCSSVEGCHVVRKLRTLEPLWEAVCMAVEGEGGTQPQQQQQEQQQTLEAAMLPLLTLLATYQGTQLIFQAEDIGESVLNALSSSEVLTDMHTVALHLLVAATTVLDSAMFLQAALGYQEALLSQQSEVRVGDGEGVIIDENSFLRNHILVKSYLLGGRGERYLPPTSLQDTHTYNMPPLFSQYPPPRDYIPEKPIKSMHKKQNEVWRFLTETRHGLHDTGWLNHCRKAVRSVLASGDDIKSWLVMDILDRCVRALHSSPEELLPGSPPSSSSSPASSPSSPTTTTTTSSSSSSWWTGMATTPTMPTTSTSSLPVSRPAPSIAASRHRLYGSELQLLMPSPSVRENLTDIIKYTQSHILLNTSEECDWFTMILFLIYGGNFDRCGAGVSGMSRLMVGGVLWPGLADALTVSHHITPGEMTWAGIIHSTQLILSIETPTLYLALQTTQTWLWGAVGEWIRCVFLGVLPWSEVCHYLVLVLLNGADYTIYFLVALLRHLQGFIVKHSGSRKSLVLLQTSTISGWRAGDHLTYMEALCRRHRRTVLPDLTRPLHSRRHHYTPRQL
ncbi:hypothetical protein Pcinc_019471 [Petrolisthes cinctipes]|uniref:Uncharacterized protein n=1 Tax=Petrolisthes cinctipes TaxID=88211 RepID=A0AAE1KHP2_PETCI|nr:hypothetical protein Pcinc_019471 [Petrolisthes cinctipes]